MAWWQLETGCPIDTHASSCIGETSLQNQEIRFLQLQYGHYAIMPLRHYAITPLRHYASTAITPLPQYGHYAIMPLRHYASTPVRPLRQYASTAIMAIMPLRHSGHYTSMPVRPLRHSPHSLASVKDMYAEMGFPLNLYWQAGRNRLKTIYKQNEADLWTIIETQRGSGSSRNLLWQEWRGAIHSEIVWRWTSMSFQKVNTISAASHYWWKKVIW